MKVVAIDLGTKCGISYGDSKDPIIENHFVVNLSQEDGFTGGSFHAFNLILKAIVNVDLGAEDVHIVCERPSTMPRWFTLRIHHGLYAIVQMVAGGSMGRITTSDVPPLTIKKYWTGSGRASKKDMVEQTQRLYPEVKDDNQSDSIALFHYYQTEVLGDYNEH